MKALLIEFDLSSGKRAGGINPKDPKLQCHGWQNFESVPALEIRVVEDDRDLSQYEAVSGVTILDGKDAINAAIEEKIPTMYKIVDMSLVLAHMKEKGMALDTLVGKNMKEIAQEALAKGVAGVIERKPQLI